MYIIVRVKRIKFNDASTDLGARIYKFTKLVLFYMHYSVRRCPQDSTIGPFDTAAFNPTTHPENRKYNCEFHKDTKCQIKCAGE